MAFATRELSPTTANVEITTEMYSISAAESDDEASSSSGYGTGAQRHMQKRLPAADDEHSDASKGSIGAQQQLQFLHAEKQIDCSICLLGITCQRTGETEAHEESCRCTPGRL